MTVAFRKMDERTTTPVRNDWQLADQLVRRDKRTSPVLDTELAQATLRDILRQAAQTKPIRSDPDPLSTFSPAIKTFVLVPGLRLANTFADTRIDCTSPPATGILGISFGHPVVMRVDRFGQNEQVSSLAAVEGMSGSALADSAEATKRFAAAKTDAVRFLAKLPADLSRPRASLAEDGEVVLEWTGRQRRAVVDFEGDHHFGYALLHDGRFRAGAHAGNLDAEQLPSDLLLYLRELATIA